MKKSLIIWHYLCGLIVALIIVCVLFIFTYNLFDENTKYSFGYSGSRFKKIIIGMSEVAVRDILGSPLRIIVDSNGRILRMIDYQHDVESISYPDLPENSEATPTGKIFYYSIPGKTSDNWHVRTVSFSTKCIVIDVHKEFYID